MKKNVILMAMVLFLNFTFAQDVPELKITREGVEPVFVKIDSLDASAIYQKTLLWVQENYTDSKNAVKENSPSEFLKVEGFKRKAWYYTSMGIKNYNHMSYSIEVEFENNGFIFNYLIGDFYMLEGNSAQYDYRAFFKKDGTIRKKYKDAVPSIELTMNNLLLSLYNSITGNFVQMQEKDLNKYLNTLQKSLSKDSKNPNTHFDLACFYSLIEDDENAYNHLSKAVSFGFSDKERLEKEPDLKWLRFQPDYQLFVANGYKFEVIEQVKPTIEESSPTYIEELRELAKLKEEGIITEEEFNSLKQKILERVNNQ